MNLLLNNEASLSTENIKVQKDTVIVRTLNSYFEELITVINNDNVKEGRALSNRNVRTIFARIDKAIKDRFGFNVKSIESVDSVLAVQTTPSNNYSVLAGDIVSKYNDINDYLKEVGQGRVDQDDVDVKTVNWQELLKTYLQSIDAVDRKLESSNIVVDMKAGKIFGYPDASFASILVNPVRLISVAGLNASEMTAVYLHEIGHVFTHLEYTYRTVKNTTTLIESLLDEVGRNKEPLDALKLSYHKTFGTDDLKDSTNIVSAVVGVTSKYTDELRNFGNNTYSNKDSERLADEFVVRFGEGPALVSSLDKLSKLGFDFKNSGIIDIGLTMLVIYIVSLLVGMFLPLIGLVMTSIITGVIGGLAVYAVMGFCLYVLYMIIATLFDRGIDTEFPYDSPKRRVLRIKNELVRQLRTEGVDKKTKEALLMSINTMITASESLDADNESVIYKFVGKLFDYSKEQNEMRSLDDAVNDLMNNDLHVAVAKLETI